MSQFILKIKHLHSGLGCNNKSEMQCNGQHAQNDEESDWLDALAQVLTAFMSNCHTLELPWCFFFSCIFLLPFFQGLEPFLVDVFSINHLQYG